MNETERDVALREQSLQIDPKASYQKLENVSDQFLKIRTPARINSNDY